MQIGMMPLIQGHPGTSDAEIYKQELDLALQAESLGFDLLMPVEHHFFDYAMIPDNVAFLSYVAGRTTTIKLMPCAFILPWNDPLRVTEKASGKGWTSVRRSSNRTSNAGARFHSKGP